METKDPIERLYDLFEKLSGHRVNDPYLPLLLEVKDEIEAQYVKLPIDADGETIRPGDTLVRGQELPFKVLCIEYNDSGVRVFNENSFGITHCQYRHAKPDNVKELLRELMSETVEWCHYSGPMSGTRTQNEIVADYADRIRRAVEHD